MYEDNPAAARLMSRLLEARENCEVYLAHNGAAGLNIMREIKPALGIWYHQDLNIISPGVGLEGTMRSAYSRLTGIPIKRITGGRYTGVAATWQRNTIKNGMAFVVELGKTLNSDQAKVHSSAVLNISMLLRDALSSKLGQ